ncbi:hypothetical protein GCM10010145_49550 [Streptomyces ruber]|uniref:Uncharacterized protein n=2 Tax=Streptomyces TaxID=1883 RepID=A0A918EUE7_9ACTN|nr:hypothetical protein GCM10010145_49550 [Streptomyces ruber]
MLEGADHHFGYEHRLGDDEQSTDGTEADDRTQEEAGGPGVTKEAWVDRFHVKHTLLSAGVFHVKHTPRPGEPCFT